MVAPLSTARGVSWCGARTPPASACIKHGRHHIARSALQMPQHLSGAETVARADVRSSCSRRRLKRPRHAHVISLALLPPAPIMSRCLSACPPRWPPSLPRRASLGCDRVRNRAHLMHACLARSRELSSCRAGEALARRRKPCDGECSARRKMLHRAGVCAGARALYSDDAANATRVM